MDGLSIEQKARRDRWTSVYEIPADVRLKMERYYVTMCPICMISSPIFLRRPAGSHTVHALDTGFSRYVCQLESTHLNTRTAHHLTKHEEARYATNVVIFAPHSPIVRFSFLQTRCTPKLIFSSNSWKLVLTIVTIAPPSTCYRDNFRMEILPTVSKRGTDVLAPRVPNKSIPSQS